MQVRAERCQRHSCQGGLLRRSTRPCSRAYPGPPCEIETVMVVEVAVVRMVRMMVLAFMSVSLVVGRSRVPDCGKHSPPATAKGECLGSH